MMTTSAEVRWFFLGQPSTAVMDALAMQEDNICSGTRTSTCCFRAAFLSA